MVPEQYSEQYMEAYAEATWVKFQGGFAEALMMTHPGGMGRNTHPLHASARCWLPGLSQGWHNGLREQAAAALWGPNTVELRLQPSLL